MTRLARIISRLRERAMGVSGSVAQRWRTLPIRGIREISGYKSSVRAESKKEAGRIFLTPSF